jgi:hypothetical protein
VTGGCRLDRRPEEEQQKAQQPATPMMTPTLRVPVVPDGLVEHLRETFKARVDASYDLREYDRQVGQQAVIEHLQKLWVDQNPKD